MVEDAIIQETMIDASPETIFEALTTPEALCEWWGDENSYRCTSWIIDLRVGGHWRAEGTTTRGGTFWVEGEYLEVEPPTILAYTWKPSWVDVQPTMVRWVITSSGRGTLVHVTHSGFAGNAAALKDHKGGLPAVIAWLKRYAESLVSGV